MQSLGVDNDWMAHGPHNICPLFSRRGKLEAIKILKQDPVKKQLRKQKSSTGLNLPFFLWEHKVTRKEGTGIIPSKSRMAQG